MELLLAPFPSVSVFFVVDLVFADVSADNASELV